MAGSLRWADVRMTPVVFSVGCDVLGVDVGADSRREGEEGEWGMVGWWTRGDGVFVVLYGGNSSEVGLGINHPIGTVCGVEG